MKLRIISLITITILFLLVEAYFLIYGIYELQETNSPVLIFWLDLYSVPIRLSLTCLIIPITIFVVGLRSDKWKPTNSNFVAAILLALVIANAIGLAALPGGIGRHTEQQSDLRFEGYAYRITHSYGTLGFGTRPLLDLYQCDALGFLCHNIYRYEQTRSNQSIEWSENSPWQSELIPDPAAHTITLMINGEAVYVHQLR